ncbi:EARLY NODULIN-LIKE PROTEIN 2 [Salix koriyanagi]|uniref:EARLY NODULIN-LIKE PROTEIN 2 n=1 Tax=Salix koriyanagi TaxID=2511006 RepID=A0A9Q0PN21_9ROSI|nr:EARLY NODULIN-LIKE PROTEIN 2 [Salix koriyanagi]
MRSTERFSGSLFVFLILGFLLGLSQGYKFYVGGRDGWVTSPSERYSQWAERNRFQVNDTIFFKYKKGSDSVLIVSKDDYHSCSTKNPIKSLTDGDSTFIFDRSGPFFFISGNSDNCSKGQKLIIVVMAVRPKPLPPAPFSPITPASSPQPASSSPAVSPDGPARVPSTNNKSGSAGFTAGSLSVGLVLGASIGVSFVLGGLLS